MGLDELNQHNIIIMITKGPKGLFLTTLLSFKVATLSLWIKGILFDLVPLFHNNLEELVICADHLK